MGAMSRERDKVVSISVNYSSHIKDKTEIGIDWVSKEVADNANVTERSIRLYLDLEGIIKQGKYDSGLNAYLI